MTFDEFFWRGSAEHAMIGSVVSHYRIIEQIGAGGMGVVYRAEDQRLHRSVAMKFLPADVSRNLEARGRFEREAQTASALNHPGICTIFDIGEHDGRPYIVMELLEGQTLRQLISGRPLMVAKALGLSIEIAEALNAAHTTGIIHRDIKSSNVFIDSHGRARLLDFGLAKLASPPGSSIISHDDVEATEGFTPELHTTTGAVLGTMNTMSPEQARGEAVDARSDLFSFGVLLYEMATGKQPFAGRTAAVVFDEIFNKQQPPASQLNRLIPMSLDGVIDRALQKRPEDRYSSAAELLDDLRQLDPEDSKRPRTANPANPQEETLLHNSPDSDTKVDPASIAVLPFANLSGNAEHDYFGDGLAEELISMLMQVNGVQVVARTSAFQYKGQALDVREIGRNLNVSSILEGGFRMAGNRIRISANFINVADGYRIWSDRFDRKMEDVFALQDEIAKSIVESMEVTLHGRRSSSPMAARPIENAESYNHYLKGKFHWKKRTPDAIHKAVQHFKEALAVDDDFAKAHAGLAHCYAMLGVYAVMPRRVVMPQALAAARKALELDPNLSEAHSAIGVMQAIHDFDWELAEASFQKALELEPDEPTARYWYAMFVLLPQGRFDEALGQAQWAAQLDPISPSIKATEGLIHYMQGNYEEAIRSLDAALDLDETHPLSNLLLGWSFTCSERFGEAMAALDRCGAFPVVGMGARGWALAKMGNVDEARECLEKLLELSRQGNWQADFEAARIHIELGEFDDAIARLELTYEQRSGALYWLRVNRHFHDALSGRQRFDELLSKIRLAD